VSTDVSALENVSDMFHETWGNFAEVVVGTYLLSQQVGWLCGLPLFLVFLASRTSKYVAKNLKTRQSDWNAATQRRLAVTSAVLGSMRDVKMLGMQGAAEEHILRLRHEEMDKARRVRWMMVIYNASGELIPSESTDEIMLTVSSERVGHVCTGYHDYSLRCACGRQGLKA
jgi:hypothetical protein